MESYEFELLDPAENTFEPYSRLVCLISAALFGVEETPPERSLVLKPWRDEGVLPEGGLGVIEVEDGFFCKSEIECGCFAGFVTTKFSSYY